MTPRPTPEDDPRVASRASLLDEEREAGSDDPVAQARVILEESDERTLDRDAPPGTIEQRASEDTIDVLEPLPAYDRGSTLGTAED